VTGPRLFSPRLASGGIVGLIAGVALILLWQRPGPETPVAAPSPTVAIPDSVTLAEGAESRAGLVVEAARSVERTDAFEAPGVLALDETRTARLGAIVEGTVLRTLADVGDRVAAGTLLAEMHGHAVHDTWAEYRRALAELRRLENELSYARDAEARAERLLADRAISAQERQRAAADRVAAVEQLDMARTELRRSEEALEHLGITSGDDPTGESGETIPARTPVAGVVLERLVTPGTAVTPGMPLFVVSDLSTLWALAEVDEARLAALSVGRPVHVRVSAYGDETFDGTVSLVGDTVNPKTRRLVVRCVVPNPDRRLKPGMFAAVRVETGRPRTAVAVPAAAIQDLDGRAVVFVQHGAGRFLVRDVTVQPETDGLVEVSTGLRAGERVATQGAFLVKSELLKAVAPVED
jgi:cobalt-zinc-cadmium efflux system membrane fusion protein